MDITAIIAEYNPFHNGHLFHIEKTKEAFPNTSIVCIMSGSFVQRGEHAILTEHERAVWAIKGGADAVIRMPLWSSFSDGESFALAGIKTALKIGATRLSFGSECGDISVLNEIANILDNSSDEFKELFDKKMSEGVSYPRAICEVFKSIYPDKKYHEILKNPNDILGVLYIKALKNTEIIPFCVKRCDNGYNSNIPNNGHLSASAIRDLIEKDKDVSPFVPEFVSASLSEYKRPNNDLSSLILYKLKTINKEELKKIQDVNEGLENRIKKYAETALTIQDLLSAIKTKRYTMARLKRILLYVLFDVTKEKFAESKKADYCRLLAIKKENITLLSHLATKKVFMKYTDLDENALPLWEEENKMSDLHDILLQKNDIRNAVFV